MFWHFLSRLPFHGFRIARWIRDAFSIDNSPRKSRITESFIRAHFVAIERSSLTVMCSRVPKSYVPTRILDTPTRRRMKRKKNHRAKQRYVKDAHRTLSLACVYSASFVFSLYTEIYNRLPYKDLHAALLMLTHRLNVSLENLSRDPPGPCIAGPKSRSRLESPLIYLFSFFLYVFNILI